MVTLENGVNEVHSEMSLFIFNPILNMVDATPSGNDKPTHIWEKLQQIVDCGEQPEEHFKTKK